MKRKIVTVVGARPQFIKASAVSRAIQKQAHALEEVMVHTGQHYDAAMSQVFFDDLGLPMPRYNLNISGGQHGAMTGRMLEGVEEILLKERPDWVLIYGDTNSTLAGALAAAKLHFPIAHVEAGLRSFNMRMPEEINRILSDRISSLLFCPTRSAVDNLAREGIVAGVYAVGDVMYDVALYHGERARHDSKILATLGIKGKPFALATCHRAENTDNPAHLEEILLGLAEIAEQLPVILPLHPRTQKRAVTHGLEHHLQRLTVINPLPFLDMIALEQAAQAILTDSGGVQKEAFFFQTPCITLRQETEWTETVELGWNQIVGPSRQGILEAFWRLQTMKPSDRGQPYGHGNASQLIVQELLR